MYKFEKDIIYIELISFEHQVIGDRLKKMSDSYYSYKLESSATFLLGILRLILELLHRYYVELQSITTNQNKRRQPCFACGAILEMRLCD